MLRANRILLAIAAGVHATSMSAAEVLTLDPGEVIR